MDVLIAYLFIGVGLVALAVVAAIFAGLLFLAPGVIGVQIIREDKVTSWPGRAAAFVAPYACIWGGLLFFAVGFGRAIDVVATGG